MPPLRFRSFEMLLAATITATHFLLRQIATQLDAIYSQMQYSISELSHIDSWFAIHTAPFH